MRGLFALILILLIAAAVVFAVMSVMNGPEEDTAEFTLGTYGYRCEDGTEFTMSPSEDMQKIRIVPATSVERIPEAILSRSSDTVPEYSGSNMTVLGDGETITLTTETAATLCHPMQIPDEAPFNFGDVNPVVGYANETLGITLELPVGYSADESYEYQMNPTVMIPGVKFTIPESLRTGTNLSPDTYISVEELKTGQCTGSAFLDGTHPAQSVTEAGKQYSVASSSNAGAGNRYEETVYALPGTNPCRAVRYLIHYTAVENYDPGTVFEFNREALITEFDQIRRTLIVEE